MDKKTLRFVACLSLFWLVPIVLAMLVGSGAAPLTLVVNTAELSGLSAWWGSVYNESGAQDAVLTIILLCLAGSLFGLCVDMAVNPLKSLRKMLQKKGSPPA